MILEITRAARFGVLKILKKGMSSGTRIGMMKSLQKAHKCSDIASPKAGGWIQARLDRVEMQPWSLTAERHRRGKDGLFGSCVGIIARLCGAARFPFTPRTRLCGDIATTSKPRSHGWLALGIFYSGDDEKDICTIGEAWHKRLR
jgi:hypothetical protein